MTNVIRELNNKYSIHLIPSWLIEKNCRAKLAVGACLLAISDGTACFTRETEKALLFEWTNTLNSCKVSGGRFWVAKSLLK